MPKTIIDKEGNEIEVHTEEELSELQEKASAGERAKQEAEDRIKELEEKLAGLEDKDHNFKKVRESKKQLEEEKAKIEEERNQIVSTYKQEKQDAFQAMVDSVARGDKELAEKIQAKVKLFGVEDPTTLTTARMREVVGEAHTLATNEAKMPDVFSGAANNYVDDDSMSSDNKRFADTQEGQRLSRRLFPDLWKKRDSK